jgi:predicted metalloprotease with PDZ domain
MRLSDVRRAAVWVAAACAVPMDPASAQDVRDRDAAVTPVAADARFLPPGSRPASYRLGINVQNSPTGVLVASVSPGSLAQSVGIEPGDTIVCVSGYQVGYVGDRLFDLGDEIAERRAGVARAVPPAAPQEAPAPMSDYDRAMLEKQNRENMRLLQQQMPVVP